MAADWSISLDSPEAWREALRGIPHTFASTWEHCRAMALTSQLETYLYCFESGSTRIVCPLSERPIGRYIDIATPFGLPGFTGTAEYKGFAAHWNGFAAQHGYVCGYIGLNPVLGCDAHRLGFSPTPYNSVYMLDLTLSIADLFGRLDQNRKRQLRSWEDIHASLVLDREVLARFLVNTYPDHLRRVGASAAYHFSRETLLALAYSDHVFMVGAGSDAAVEAVYLFPFTDYAADWFLLVTTDEGRQYTAKLLWYAVHHFKAMGIPVLNLGGGAKENDSVAQAKQRYGPQRLPVMALKHVYDTETYIELCRQVGVDHRARDGYFPAYRRPEEAPVR